MPKNEGHTLVGLMRGVPSSLPTVAFSDFQDDRRVITTGRWKFILRGNLTSTMFDLVADPHEKNELDASASRSGAGIRACCWGSSSVRPIVRTG